MIAPGGPRFSRQYIKTTDYGVNRIWPTDSRKPVILHGWRSGRRR